MIATVAPPPITVVGHLSLDQIVCRAGRFDGVPGGAAYYCAAGASVAGGTVRLVARTGSDFPQSALDALARLGVAVEVERLPGASRRSMLHDPSGADRTLPHMRDPEWWEAARRFAPPVPEGEGVFVFTAMPADSLRDQLAARGADDLLVVDTSPAYAAISPAEILSLVPFAYAFAPSREETRLMLPGLDDDAALAHLARHAALVVQKRGPDGLALLRQSGAILRAASRAGTVVDTTGAGDSVVGALAAMIANGSDDSTLLAVSSEIAAKTVAGIGAESLLACR